MSVVTKEWLLHFWDSYRVGRLWNFCKPLLRSVHSAYRGEQVVNSCCTACSYTYCVHFQTAFKFADTSIKTVCSLKWTKQFPACTLTKFLPVQGTPIPASSPNVFLLPCPEIFPRKVTLCMHIWIYQICMVALHILLCISNIVIYRDHIYSNTAGLGVL